MGQGGLIGELLARNRTFAQATFSPLCFSTRGCLSVTLREAAGLNSEMGIKSPVACLLVQVKAWGSSPCLTVGSQKGCLALHISVRTWSFSSLLYKG